MTKKLKKQFNMLILIAGVMYVLFVFCAFNFFINGIITKLKEDILLSNAKELSGTLEDYIQDELTLLSRFANEKCVVNWMEGNEASDEFKDIDEPLRVFSSLLNVQRLFFVRENNLNYYLSNKEQKIFTKPEYYTTLDQTKLEDQWYFNTKELLTDFDINVDNNIESDELMLWMNILVKANSEYIGIIGCDFSINQLVKEVIDKSISKESTYVIDEYGSIQLSNNLDLIESNSFEKGTIDEHSFYTLLNNSKDQVQVENFLENDALETSIITGHSSDYKSIVISKIPSIKWSVVHIYKGESLYNIDGLFKMVILLILLSSILSLLFIGFTKRNILKPLHHLNDHVLGFEKHSGISSLTLKDNEIGQLGDRIVSMERRILMDQALLEERIAKREEEIHQLYSDISINEKNLKKLLNALPIGVIRYTEDLDMVFCNQSALSLLGVESLKDYQSKTNKLDYFPFASKEEKYTLKNAIMFSEILIDYRVSLQITSFRKLIILMNLYKVEIDGIIYYEGIMKDITKSIIYEKQLIKRANYDNLTGVLSRAAFINRLDEYIKYHFPEKSNSYFITLDFDYFKNINDLYGHLAGDLVLKEIMGVISRFIDDMGIVGRIGGDEFAITIWEMKEEGIVRFLEQIRQSVEEHEIKFETFSFKITVSMGYTQVIKGDYFKTLYYRSDQALYEAKGLGKNQICCFEKLILDSKKGEQ